jgi:hypothetical protein
MLIFFKKGRTFTTTFPAEIVTSVAIANVVKKGARAILVTQAKGDMNVDLTK